MDGAVRVNEGSRLAANAGVSTAREEAAGPQHGDLLRANGRTGPQGGSCQDSGHVIPNSYGLHRAAALVVMSFL